MKLDKFFGFSANLSLFVIILSILTLAVPPNAVQALVYDPAVPIPNPDPDPSDQFTEFTGLDIDGKIVVVGTPLDDPGTTPVSSAGSAYVFDCNTDPCTLLDTLDNPDPDVGDLFGYSVGVSGNTVVVGAFNDDPGAVNDAGSAYVFDCTASIAAGDGSVECTAPVHIPNPDPDTDDDFGLSVDIDGANVVVGAYRDDPGTTPVSNAGSAYLYICTNSGTLSCVLKDSIISPDPDVSDFFGFSVGVSGHLVLVDQSQWLHRH